MDTSGRLKQDPPPGTYILRFVGDSETFILSLSYKEKGSAWLRTNIGRAKISRAEIIKNVLYNEPPLGLDWFDIPMEPADDFNFKVILPLCEVGHFEAKAFFLKKGEDKPKWPEGPNIVINVEPAESCCANIIYNAFVRQFGPNKSGEKYALMKKSWIKELDQEDYAVIPPSGTFRDLIKELDFIIGELGCTIIQLLPVNPTPTTFARMGRFGSPFAALSFTAVDPAQAEFDPKATPLEQFIELVDAIHARGAKVIIDIAVNHTGWGARLHETHPEWLIRNPDGRIEVPGAWGVRWEDLTSLDYSCKDLWVYIAGVFQTWCRRGVDGFRCDAGYMVPVPAWRYIIAEVREKYPDTIFFLEGLGGKLSVTRDLLNRAGFNWAYSELFQNYDRRQIEKYLPGTDHFSKSIGLMVHFAETHDNNRLASRSNLYAGMRTALCALSSQSGAFGFANGVEWFATEKIDVHDSPSLNWGAACNQVSFIRRLNSILKFHPVFYDETDLKMIQTNQGNYIALLRHHLPSGKKLLILVNLDDFNQTLGSWDPHLIDGHLFIDLLSNAKITVDKFKGQNSLLLSPGQVLCISTDRDDLKLFSYAENKRFGLPEYAERKRLRAKAMEVLCFYRGVCDLGQFDLDQAAKLLSEDPVDYCRSLNHFSMESRAVTWRWPRDEKRETMVPPGHFLFVCCDNPFHARIEKKRQVIACERSLLKADGKFFTLFSPLPPSAMDRSCSLKLTVYTSEKGRHIEAPLLFLSNAKDVKVKRIFSRTDLMQNPLVILDTNGRGGMLRAQSFWGELKSRYDALLAANLSQTYPEDRWIMFARCRGWVVFQGYSQEISFDCLNKFSFDYNLASSWRFHIPVGQGEHIVLTVKVQMLDGENAVKILFFRHPAKEKTKKLDDSKDVKLILRPDIEDRNFHQTTKAYLGAENIFPSLIAMDRKGFSFTPHQDRELHIKIDKGDFVLEPEWHYMVYRPVESDRGLDPDSDLFSPGYFYSMLKGGESEEVLASISGLKDQASLSPAALPQETRPFAIDGGSGLKMDEALCRALDRFIVKRGELKSVIAGYPWFLDWGRDSLIFVRGLVAAGKIKDSMEILQQFGRFEKNGTIPNMICGKDAANRDTSDAPLWFCTACSDLIQAAGNENFLDSKCGTRSIREIIFSIGKFMIEGTPNGIRMDPQSGLIFSPAHFTWMDTNYPACTPREGYPIEIQALWFAALALLNRIDPLGKEGGWKEIYKQVQASILDLFILRKEGYLADCLSASSGVPAGQAEQDDALRPNQLFAVTMGAVRDTAVCRNIVTACEELLVPGAIRSLADRPVRRPLEIAYHDKILVDPNRPYQGRYKGDEDTARKPAYHNGTAWTWLFPAFCEAWVKVYGEGGKDTALSWLGSSRRLLSQGCAGQIPEILDGDFPHIQRGCDAQAWGISELLRVWKQVFSI